MLLSCRLLIQPVIVCRKDTWPVWNSLEFKVIGCLKWRDPVGIEQKIVDGHRAPHTSSRPLQRANTQRNIFKILLNQPEIRLYLPFSDWFGTKRTSVWLKINGKMINTIWFQVDLIRFWKCFSVCRYVYLWMKVARPLVARSFFWEQTKPHRIRW